MIDAGERHDRGVSRVFSPEALDGDAHANARALLRDELPLLAPAVILACPAASWLADAADSSGFAPLVFAPPSTERRRRLWRERATERGLTLSPSDIDTLASRFRLTPAQIGLAAARAAMTLHATCESNETTHLCP